LHPHTDPRAGYELPDPGDSAPSHLERRIRRQSAMFGRRAGMRYVARLVELDEGAVDRQDFYERAGAVLGLAPERVRGLVEGPRQRLS